MNGATKSGKRDKSCPTSQLFKTCFRSKKTICARNALRDVHDLMRFEALRLLLTVFKKEDLTSGISPAEGAITPLRLSCSQQDLVETNLATTSCQN